MIFYESILKIYISQLFSHFRIFEILEKLVGNIQRDLEKWNRKISEIEDNLKIFTFKDISLYPNNILSTDLSVFAVYITDTRQMKKFEKNPKVLFCNSEIFSRIYTHRFKIAEGSHDL